MKFMFRSLQAIILRTFERKIIMSTIKTAFKWLYRFPWKFIKSESDLRAQWHWNFAFIPKIALTVAVKQTTVYRTMNFHVNLPTNAYIELPTARFVIISKFIYIFEQKLKANMNTQRFMLAALTLRWFGVKSELWSDLLTKTNFWQQFCVKRAASTIR